LSSVDLSNVIFKLFEGWRATVDRSATGFRVTVPRMSEGACKVITSEIQAKVPEIYDVKARATPEGGYVFELAIEESAPDSVQRFLVAARGLGFPELAAPLEALASDADPVAQAAKLGGISLDLEAKKELDLARRAIALACRLAPANVRLKFNQAVLLLKLGELATAIQLFEEILQLDPDFEPALHNLAAYHAQRGDRKTAKEYLARLIAGHPRSSSAQVLAGQFAHDEGQLGPALEHFLRAVQIDETNAEAQYRTAIVLRDLELTDRARQHWDRYRKLVRDIPEGRCLYARVMIEGEPAGAAIGIDGQTVGPAPRGLMNLVPGPHVLAVMMGMTELTLDVKLEEGANYLARYDLKKTRFTIQPTAVAMTVPDEDGRLVPGPELARRVIERVSQPADGGGLSARAIFATVLFECLKDGTLSDSEKDLVFAVKQLLRISPDVHKTVFREVEERLKTEKAPREPASPDEIYRMLVRRALEDGQVLSEENRLLEDLARVLELPRANRREIEKAVSAEFSGKSN
jgi:tetratricopeptide (TPR) repeat protein